MVVFSRSCCIGDPATSGISRFPIVFSGESLTVVLVQDRLHIRWKEFCVNLDMI